MTIAIITAIGVILAAAVTALAATLHEHEEPSVCSVRLRVIPGHHEEYRHPLPWMGVQTRWVPDRFERLAEFADGERRWLDCSRVVFDQLRAEQRLAID